MDAHLVAPSILSADFGNLAEDIDLINHSEADWIHVDVMDGCFVPNISFGFPVMNALQKHARKPLDVHLMIVQPERYIERFARAGAASISVHYEAVVHLHSVISRIKSLGLKAGVAINPHTPVNVLEDLIRWLDIVLIMSVNPGFGGQKFIDDSIHKILKTKELINATGSNALIEVDGGISPENARQVLNAGADILVAGSAVFGAENPRQVIHELKTLSRNTLHA